MIRSDRGVTSPLGYVLTLAIAAILVTGLIVGMSDRLDSQRAATATEQMEVVGQQVAGSLEAADRLNRTSSNNPDELSLARQLPDTILGAGYSVEITADSVTVRSPRNDRDMTVEHTVDTGVAESTVEGGAVVVRHNASAGHLEVEQDA